jgi:hypothetical protein
VVKKSPGGNWMMMKVTIEMANSVGIIIKTRRTMNWSMMASA